MNSHLNFKTKSKTFAKEKKSCPKGGEFYCLGTINMAALTSCKYSLSLALKINAK